MLIFRAIIVSALLTMFSAASLHLPGLDFDPWVAGITVFTLGFVIAIVNPHLISGFFEHERWGRLRVPLDDSDDTDTVEKRISEKS